MASLQGVLWDEPNPWAALQPDDYARVLINQKPTTPEWLRVYAGAFGPSIDAHPIKLPGQPNYQPPALTLLGHIPRAVYHANELLNQPGWHAQYHPTYRPKYLAWVNAGSKEIPPFWVEAWEPELTAGQRNLLLRLHAGNKHINLKQLDQAIKEQL